LSQKVHPGKVLKGLEALQAKIDQWEKMVEKIHNMEDTTPEIAGNFISCNFLPTNSFFFQNKKI